MKRVFGNWWVLTGLIVVLLLAVLCVGLPLFIDFLRPMWVRIAIAVVVIGVWLLLGFLRRRKARKAAEAIAEELSRPSAADQESAAVAARMNEALTALKSTSGGRRDYLYSRPWYVIIGPPGAGKTTALVNSGLRFPFAEQSLKGVGGTRNLDFWFADEAALVDTAGRYTTQDSDASVDTQGWKSFLALLKRHRPLSPINGVIVALGVDELLKADRAGIDRHAALVRRRLAELRQTLEVAVPVYLLFTKADLLAGFVEYYDDLDVEGRRAVLGASLPVENGKPKLDDLVVAFDELVAAQSARQAKRLFEEVDQTRRGLILGFPAQLAALRNRFARFVDGAFIAGDQPGGILRGFYFTSGVQEGAPLDRILAGVAEVYQDPRATRGGSGRTYFLNRLMTDVVFKEAGLVEADPAARARQHARMSAGLVGVATVAALVLLVWGVSFVKNRSFQSELGASSAQAATLTRETGVDLIEVRDSDPDLEQSLGVLRALRNLPQGYAAQDAGEPGLLRRFGLYQSSHAAQAVESYRDGLRRIMLPRLLLRLEQYMGSHGGDPLSLYNALKVYLMLGGQGPLDPAAVKSWVTTDWTNEQFPGADRSPVRKELTDHLTTLLDDQDLAADWPERRGPLDGTVIAKARAALATLSLADRAYAVLREKALANGGSPWMASAALSAGDAQAFANGAEVLQLQVPYFYTRAGYEQAYQLGLATVAEDLKKDLWVMGDAAATTGMQAQVGQIRPGVAALYAKDYIAAWEKVATVPKPANYFGDAAAMGAFTKAPSPLKVLLLELRKNTTFTGGSGAAKQALGARLAQTRIGGAAKTLGAGESSGVDAGAQIASYFKPIQDYVGDGKAPAPIDDFVNAVKQAGTAVASAKLAGGGIGSDAVQGQMATAMGSVMTSAGGAPPQLQGFVAGATSGGKTASVTAAQGAITEAYTNAVLPDCKLATQDKYPFFGTATTDASLVDVQKVFAMNGSLDAFLQQRIKPLLDVSGPIWRWNTTNPTAAALNPSTPDEFVKAQQLRDMMMGGVTTKFEAKAFGGGVDAVELTVGSTTYKFDPANMGEKPVIWSAQGNVPR
ncbi:MAG: type VI secretion system membrane subunit TssM, partial [Novosphingobium sp.]|nr:type VI secretion system membrane subunit TssM [Novosphingobium sp.]